MTKTRKALRTHILRHNVENLKEGKRGRHRRITQMDEIKRITQERERK